ncbi:MAG: hypothetical protein ACD_79C01164G0001 [uncultured bacterium]|nr:MAG: hypothetical protein ACD_79C01164G0001 [uncultured bacterium]
MTPSIPLNAGTSKSTPLNPERVVFCPLYCIPVKVYFDPFLSRIVTSLPVKGLLEIIKPEL